jgi:hypothetical protein
MTGFGFISRLDFLSFSAGVLGFRVLGRLAKSLSLIKLQFGSGECWLVQCMGMRVGIMWEKEKRSDIRCTWEVRLS